MIRFLKGGLNALYAKAFGKKIPLLVNYITTFRCDARCSYCRLPNGVYQGREMNIKAALGMISNLTDMGMQRINFGGGEPLLYKGLQKVKKKAYDCGVITILTSNCLKLKKEHLDSLNLLFICLNGTARIHDNIRGKGSFKAQISALRMAKRRNVNVCINMIATRYNLDQLDFVLDTARKYDAKVNVQPVYDLKLAMVETDDIKHMMPNIKNFASILLEKKKEGIITNSKTYLKHLRDKGYGEFNIGKCLMGNLSIVVDPYGGVFPCYHFLGTKTLNGTQAGWNRAFNAINIHNCNSCRYSCHIEQNLLFRMNPEALLNIYMNRGLVS